MKAAIVVPLVIPVPETAWPIAMVPEDMAITVKVEPLQLPIKTAEAVRVKGVLATV